MNDVDYIKHRMKARKVRRLNDNHFKHFYNYMVKVMIAIMIGIGVMTYFKVWPEQTVIKKFIMEDLNVNALVQNVSAYFSPFFGKKDEAVPVANVTEYQLINKNYYKSGSNQVSILCEGTVIYKGHQDILKDYVIIQGINGLKITYGCINDSNLNLYDYVHAGDTIGVYDKQFIMIFEYDNKEITYEEAKQML